MSSLGWEVVHAIDAGEKEIAYWLRHASSLTQQERRRISGGDFAPLARPLEPEWSVGQEVKVASNLTIRIEGVRWGRRGYVTTFLARDFRPRLLRRAPHSREPSKPKRGKNESDQRYAERVEAWRRRRATAPTADAIDAARQDGSYTRASVLAVPESDDGVDDETLKAITDNSLRTYNVLNAKRMRQREERNLASRLRQVTAQARKKGIDVTPEIAAMKKQLDALERKIAA